MSSSRFVSTKKRKAVEGEEGVAREREIERDVHVQALLVGSDGRGDLSWVPFLVYLKGSLDDGGVGGGGEGEVEGSKARKQYQ